METLQNKGMLYNKRSYSDKINAVSCDAPTSIMVKQCKGPGARVTIVISHVTDVVRTGLCETMNGISRSQFEGKNTRFI